MNKDASESGAWVQAKNLRVDDQDSEGGAATLEPIESFPQKTMWSPDAATDIYIGDGGCLCRGIRDGRS